MLFSLMEFVGFKDCQRSLGESEKMDEEMLGSWYSEEDALG